MSASDDVVMAVRWPGSSEPARAFKRTRAVYCLLLMGILLGVPCVVIFYTPTNALLYLLHLWLNVKSNCHLQ